MSVFSCLLPESVFSLCHVRVVGGGHFELWGLPSESRVFACLRLRELGASQVRCRAEQSVVRFRAKQSLVFALCASLSSCPLASPLACPLPAVRVLPSGLRLVAA